MQKLRKTLTHSALASILAGLIN